jgi:hypothetical protein
MVDLLCGIVPMDSAQPAELQWVCLQEVVTFVDIQLIHDQLERFTNSCGYMLHAKIKPSSNVHQIVDDAVVNHKDSGNVGVTQDGVVALKSKKSVVDIVRHAGILRKSTADISTPKSQGIEGNDENVSSSDPPRINCQGNNNQGTKRVVEIDGRQRLTDTGKN